MFLCFQANWALKEGGEFDFQEKEKGRVCFGGDFDFNAIGVDQVRFSY